MAIGSGLHSVAGGGRGMKKRNLQLLSDDQVRRFIADGFIIVDSQLDAAFHQQMAQYIAYALEY